MTLAELGRFDVGRINPDSAYFRFFPDQFPRGRDPDANAA